MRQFIKDVQNDRINIFVRLFFAISISLAVIIYVVLNNERGSVYYIPTFIDTAIPFNKYFVVPYIFWYFYVCITILYFAIFNEKKYFRLLICIVTGMLVCFLIYYFYPTVVSRPTVYGNDIFAKAVRAIYNRDKPYNCFPSIHVLDSVLMAVYLNREQKLSRELKIVSTLIAISIIFSTMFIKQHYFYDAVAGTILAYCVYAVYNYKEVLNKIQEKFIPSGGINQEMD